MKKKWIISLVCMVLLSAIIGVFYIINKQQKPTIAVVLRDSNSQYWKIMSAGMEKAFHNLRANGTIYFTEKDDEDQLLILKKVLKQKPDALIVSLANPSMAVPILKEYKKEQIPVLLVDTDADWADKTSFIGTDNTSLGIKAGELLASMLQPNDKVALIGQIANNSTSTDRIEGAKKTLNAAGINIIADKMVSGANHIPVVINNILQDNPDLKGVYAINDELALNVMKYFNTKGLSCTVVGSDGVVEMIKYIENGKIKGTIAQNPYDMGYTSVDNALKAINGETVEKKFDSDVDIITNDNAKSKREFLEEILR